MKLSNLIGLFLLTLQISSSLFFFSPAAAAASSSSSLSQLPFSTPWLSFLNLTGSHPGDRNPSLHLLKKYLHRFGYLHPPCPCPSSYSNFTDIFDDSLKSAIKTYQHNFHLDPTGLLDIRTITNLVSPRCGVADIVNATSSMSGRRHLYTYFPDNPMWPASKRHLTYAFSSTSAVSISLSVLRPVFARAFGRWSAATMLNFTEVVVGPTSHADITIGFFVRDHGDGVAFDGPLGTLAHAFAPTNGRFHIDAEEEWVAEGDVADAESNNAVDMESVAVHEIGHLLGLGHSSVEDSIMFPLIGTRTRKVELRGDDVEAVQKLYGSNPNYVAGPATTGNQEMSSNGGGGVRLSGLGWVGVICWVLTQILYVL